MEISNNTSSSYTRFLPGKQKSNAARTTVLLTHPLKQEQQNSTTENIGRNLLKMGSNEEQISAIQPLNAIRTQQYAHSNHQTSTSNDKAVAHEQQRARYALRAIASYNRIEHSQYGQELVNRIELAV